MFVFSQIKGEQKDFSGLPTENYDHDVKQNSEDNRRMHKSCNDEVYDEKAELCSKSCCIRSYMEDSCPSNGTSTHDETRS